MSVVGLCRVSCEWSESSMREPFNTKLRMKSIANQEGENRGVNRQFVSATPQNTAFPRKKFLRDLHLVFAPQPLEPELLRNVDEYSLVSRGARGNLSPCFHQTYRASHLNCRPRTVSSWLVVWWKAWWCLSPLNEAVTEGIRRIEDIATGRVDGLTEEQYRAAMQ